MSSHLCISEGYLILGIGFFALICLLFRYEFFPRCWPGKENWEGNFLWQQAKIGKEADRADTGRPQRQDDCFVLRIAKPNHKGRVIDRIEFVSNHPASYPPKYLVTISGEHGTCDNWNRTVQSEDHFGQGIVIELTPPLKVSHFYVAIVETRGLPNPQAHWAFRRIQIHELRLFGRFWGHDV